MSRLSLFILRFIFLGWVMGPVWRGPPVVLPSMAVLGLIRARFVPGYFLSTPPLFWKADGLRSAASLVLIAWEIGFADAALLKRPARRVPLLHSFARSEAVRVSLIRVRLVVRPTRS